MKDGKAETIKMRIIAIDKEKRLVTYDFLEGDIMKEYKVFKPTIQAIPKGKGSIVKWSAEYEKLNDKIPTPDHLLAFGMSFSEDIGNHLVSA